MEGSLPSVPAQGVDAAAGFVFNYGNTL